MATHAGVHIAWMSLCLLYVMQTTTVKLLFVFLFCTKIPVLVTLVTGRGDKKEEETRNSYLRADLKKTQRR